MAHGEPGTSEHGGQSRPAKALVAPRSVEAHHGLTEAVDCSTIVTLAIVSETEAVVRQRVQDDIPVGGGECEGTLGRGDGLAMRAPIVEMG
jgi:hypothetical protein